MVKKLLEVMHVDEIDIALLKGYDAAATKVSSINARLITINQEKKQATHIPHNAEEKERITGNFKIAMLEAEEESLKLQASLIMEKALRVIEKIYPPKKSEVPITL